MNELKEGIEKIVPFLGAGISIPYGYFSWRTLLLALLERCSQTREADTMSKKEEIKDDIDCGHYIDAANKMDDIFANLSSTVSHMIERVAKANPITIANGGLLGEYLHLFPSRKYLTTNYDKVIEDVLKLQDDISIEPIVATVNKADQSIIRMDLKNKANKATIYYLHGTYTEPNSITLSGDHYDDYYGAEHKIKSSLRRFLPKELRKLHNDHVFLYIGCSMTIKEDRILRLLREFYGNLQNYPRSYALLNVNEVAATKIPLKNWETLEKDKQKELNTKLKQKEDELEDMNVRVIWYSAPMGDKEESAKHELLEYILRNRREEWESTIEHRRQVNLRNIEERKQLEKQQQMAQMEWEKAFENCEEAEEPFFQVRDFLREKILTRADTTEKLEIAFPMYKVEGGLYQISLISQNEKFYLSDNGTTYAELDKIFELKEPDVIKNLVAILKQYGCQKHPNTTEFITECTLENVNIKMSHLIQALSFMLNMKIFYV